MSHARIAAMRGAAAVGMLLMASTGLNAQGQNCPATGKGPLPLKYVGGATAAAITPCDLMNRLYKYADDSMMGRQVGTEYNVKATNYIAAEVKRFGLQPAGDNGTFIQTLAMVDRRTDPASTITVGGQTFKVAQDFFAQGFSPNVKQFTDVQVMYGGVLRDTMNLLDSATVAGKIVLVRPAAPLTLAFTQTAGYRAYTAAMRGAMRVVTIVGDTLPTASVLATMGPAASQVTPGAPAPTPAFPNFAISTRLAEAALGASLATAPKGLVGKTLTTDIRVIESNNTKGRNVVAILPGSDPKLKGQYVAIGAHNDHVGFSQGSRGESDSLKVWGNIAHPAGAEGGRTTPLTAEEWTKINSEIAEMRKIYPARPDSIFNGADDDGSGSVSVLEIAEAFAKSSVKPKRSIIFVWHTGEESGMWGSAYFMDHPTVSRDSIVAQLNIDMVGRGAPTDITGQGKAPQGSRTGPELHGGDRYLQLVGSRRLSTELGDMVEKINTDKKHGFSFDYNIDADGHQQNIYCRSDHWSYGKWGVPVTFFTTGGHADYHQVTDEPQYIRYGHMAAVDSLIFDVGMAVANLDHRVVVDKPKPNPAPATACKQ